MPYFLSNQDPLPSIDTFHCVLHLFIPQRLIELSATLLSDSTGESSLIPIDSNF